MKEKYDYKKLLNFRSESPMNKDKFVQKHAK